MFLVKQLLGSQLRCCCSYAGKSARSLIAAAITDNSPPLARSAYGGNDGQPLVFTAVAVRPSFKA